MLKNKKNVGLQIMKFTDEEYAHIEDIAQYLTLRDIAASLRVNYYKFEYAQRNNERLNSAINAGRAKKTLEYAKLLEKLATAKFANSACVTAVKFYLSTQGNYRTADSIAKDYDDLTEKVIEETEEEKTARIKDIKAYLKYKNQSVEKVLKHQFNKASDR